jgi:lipoprotein-anchoring transpeptidase ErfK/SrfK
MLARRRRSLGVLSLLVLAVTVVITITRPSPQLAAAASRDVPQTVPVGVYSANAASVPPGADADGVSAALLSVPTGGAAPESSTTSVPATWTQPAGARIHCPVTATACVDLKAKITWLQHGTQIVLRPVRMQPGEGSKKTPTGTYSITKKAAVYYSHTYGGAMPYSVFWGHDGIAYHEGTLTGFSHGCIHLSMANAKRFFAALRIGQRVYVA